MAPMPVVSMPLATSQLKVYARGSHARGSHALDHKPAQGDAFGYRVLVIVPLVTMPVVANKHKVPHPFLTK